MHGMHARTHTHLHTRTQAHVSYRFVQGWDEACIAQLKRAEHLAGVHSHIKPHAKGVVLSTYPGADVCTSCCCPCLCFKY